MRQDHYLKADSRSLDHKIPTIYRLLCFASVYDSPPVPVNPEKVVCL